jgi:hypothetical protein
VVETAKHHFLHLALLEQGVDGSPFQTAPILIFVVLTKDRHDEFRFIVIKVWQMNAQVRPRKSSLVVFVVKDDRFSKALGENGGDFGDEIPLLTSERESDSKTLRTHEIVEPQSM